MVIDDINSSPPPPSTFPPPTHVVVVYALFDSFCAFYYVYTDDETFDLDPL